jgi:3-phytase
VRLVATISDRTHNWRIRRLRHALRVGALATAAVAVTPPCGGEDGSETLLESAATEVYPAAETDLVPRGGDADDPAIWVHPGDPARSTIIGTDKLGGLAVYDLAGRQIQYLPHGDLNNVDLRDGFRLGGESVTLVTAADRTTNRLAIYRVNPATGEVVDVAARPITVGIAAYGSCMYRNPETDRFYAFVNSQKEGGDPGGQVEQWELLDVGGGMVDARRVRSFSVGSQTEGCVADDESGDLYIGEQAKGVWKYGAQPDAGTQRRHVDSTGPNGQLEADVEGLAITDALDAGYLIASSQGNSSFVVYRRPGDEYVKTFTVEAANGIDAVERSAGIDVTTADLGEKFPSGLLVVNDGSDDAGPTNFKLVPLTP